MKDKRWESIFSAFFRVSCIMASGFFMFSGCRKEQWNPNEQYESEIRKLNQISEVRDNEVRENAHRNILNAKATIFEKLDTDNSLKSWILQNRFRFPLIARTEHNNQSWEKRKLMFSDFMEFYYGSTSSEFNQSRKQDFEVFVICSFDKILSYERY